MEGGKVMKAAFLDDRRAFETVHRGLIIEKLGSMDLKSRLLNWLCSNP